MLARRRDRPAPTRRGGRAIRDRLDRAEPRRRAAGREAAAHAASTASTTSWRSLREEACAAGLQLADVAYRRQRRQRRSRASKRSGSPSSLRTPGRRSCRSRAGCSSGRAGRAACASSATPSGARCADPLAPLRTRGRAAGGTTIGAVTDPLFDLSGRVAVVTGGMGQLGAELAVALAARGMRVAILDLETEPRAGAAGLGRVSTRATIRAHACDVTDREAVEAALALVEVGLGRAAPARQRRGDRRAARRAGGGGRAVRGRAARARSSASCT